MHVGVLACRWVRSAQERGIMSDAPMPPAHDTRKVWIAMQFDLALTHD